MKKCNQVKIKINGEDENTGKPDSLSCSVRGCNVTFVISYDGWLGITEENALRLRNYLTRAIREIKKRKKKKAYF